MIGETLFGAWGNAVLLAWAILAASVALPPASVWAKRLSTIGGFYAPAALSLCWVVLLIAAMLQPASGDLFSLQGVVQRFANLDRLLLLYFECLTLSLLVSGWIVADARRRNVSRAAMIIVLPLQFLFGPAGFATYVVFRSFGAKAVIRSSRQTAGEA